MGVGSSRASGGQGARPLAQPCARSSSSIRSATCSRSPGSPWRAPARPAACSARPRRSSPPPRPVEGLMSICALPASARNAGSFIVASKARAQCGEPRRRHIRRRHVGARQRHVGGQERQHLPVGLVLRQLEHQRHVGQLGMALQRDLHEVVDLALARSSRAWSPSTRPASSSRARRPRRARSPC